MKFDAIKSLVGDLAPTIGAALGGTVGGAAAGMLANVLGCEPTPQKIEKALQTATPEQLAEIKKAELDFEVRMKELLSSSQGTIGSFCMIAVEASGGQVGRKDRKLRILILG